MFKNKNKAIGKNTFKKNIYIETFDAKPQKKCNLADCLYKIKNMTLEDIQNLNDENKRIAYQLLQ